MGGRLARRPCSPQTLNPAPLCQHRQPTCPPKWGSVPLAKVSHGEIAGWVGALSRNGAAPSTVRQTYRVLALILELAVRDGRLTRNPAIGVKLPAPHRAEKRFLTHRQVATLAKACRPPYDLVVLVLAYTGIRWGELAALRVQDVDLFARRLRVIRSMTEVNGRAVVGTPKGGKRRDVPLPGFLLELLTQHIEGKHAHELLFASPQGRVLRNNNFRRNDFDAAVKTAGLIELTPHELRHTAASLAIAAGANVKAVQRMLGHASAAMTLDV